VLVRHHQSVSTESHEDDRGVGNDEGQLEAVAETVWKEIGVSDHRPQQATVVHRHRAHVLSFHCFVVTIPLTATVNLHHSAYQKSPELSRIMTYVDKRKNMFWPELKLQE